MTAPVLTTPPVQHEPPTGSAVVLGAGMAGLLAAAVLSESFGRVVVVDRDEPTSQARPRRGVPQGKQVHALLASGADALDDLLPGFTDELRAAGVPHGDGQRDMDWYLDDHLLRHGDSALVGLTPSRPLVEATTHRRVAALRGVSFLPRHEVLGLVTTPDRSAVTGVRVRPRDGGAPGQAGSAGEEVALEADLVVDATGRGAGTAAWLAEIGAQRPEATTVRSDLVYVTRHYRLREDVMGAPLGTVVAPHPGNTRSGVVVGQEGGVVAVLLAGMLGERPPTDDAGMLDYARGLAAPQIADVIATAEPLDEPATMRYPSSVRHHYERLDVVPHGHVVVGDGLCSFNPVYGQGMTVAAMQAQLLRRLLGAGRADLPARFYRAASTVLDRPWALAAGGDLRFPSVVGHRPPGSALVDRYLEVFRAAASTDARLGTAFLRVVNMVEAPASLLAPALAARVLVATLRRRASGHQRRAAVGGLGHGGRSA